MIALSSTRPSTWRQPLGSPPCPHLGRCPREMLDATHLPTASLLSLRGAIAPLERRDPCVVAVAVEFRDEIVRLNLVQLAPPPPRLVVPHPPAAGHTAGDIPAPAQ